MTIRPTEHWKPLPAEHEAIARVRNELDLAFRYAHPHISHEASRNLVRRIDDLILARLNERLGEKS